MSKTDDIIIHNSRGEALVVDPEYLAEQLFYFGPDASKHNMRLAMSAFARKVADMRAAQRRYFQSRSATDLQNAKRLEADVDKQISPFIQLLGKV